LLPKQEKRKLEETIESLKLFDGKLTPEKIEKFRMAFHNLITEVFLNYDAKKENNKESYDPVAICDKSENMFFDFFVRFFKFDPKSAAEPVNNQMF